MSDALGRLVRAARRVIHCAIEDNDCVFVSAPAMAELEKEVNALETADEIERLREIERTALALRNDLILRADIGTSEGDHSIQASNSVWYSFYAALEGSQ